MEIVGLLLPLLYVPVIAWKGTLTIYDGVVLMIMYIAYLIVLSKLPAEDHEEIDDLESVPRAIVLAPRTKRILAISALFIVGGALIYFSAEPFLASLLALATVAGMPEFVFVQWIAPLVSEFPELASMLYWARRDGRASRRRHRGSGRSRGSPRRCARRSAAPASARLRAIPALAAAGAGILWLASRRRVPRVA